MSASDWINYQLKANVLAPPLLRVQRWRDEHKAKARPHRPDDTLTPPPLATLRMKEIMSRHYAQARYAGGVRKVAWVTSGAPIEILRALDYFIFYIDNHAALCGARREADALSEVAENEGYSRDICSYARTDIGVMLSGRTPIGQLPKPDLIVCCNNICQTILNWYRVLAEHTQAPFFLVDTPFQYGGAHSHELAFVERQLQDLVPVAEKIAGKSLSWQRLKAVLRSTRDTCELYLRILDRAKTHPAPIGAFDAFINMGPVVTLRGLPEAVDFYRELLAEIDQRIADGVGIVKHERKRVLWDNLPVWHRINWLSRTLADQGVAVVLSNYTYAWGELTPLIDPENPMASTARIYLSVLLNRSAKDKLERMQAMVRDFDLDGVILHSDRSCKPYSIGQVDQRTQLVTGLDIPALLLEADHNDTRVFSEEQVATRLSAFVETMG